MTTEQPLNIISAADWEGREIQRQEWLVEGMIPMLTTTSLAGDGGLGKSLIAMQLMTCCAGGKRFLNKDTKQAVSIGLFCEDRENQLHERQSSINQHYELNYSDIVDVNYMPRVGEDNALVVSGYDGKPAMTPLFGRFREAAIDLGAKLAVIDTAADTFMGNENIRMQVRFYVQMLNGLANDMQGAVLLLVHPSLQGLTSGSGTSGSTAWNNSVRSRWYLEKQPEIEGEQPDNNMRILTQKKSNYSAADASGIPLLWENGIFRIKLDEGGFIKKLEMRKLSSICLEVIEHLHSKNLNLSISPYSKLYAPKKIKEKLKNEYSYEDIKDVFNQLLDENRIANVQFGPPSRNLYRIEPTNALLSTLEPTDKQQSDLAV